MSDCDLLEVLHPHQTPFTISVVEHDGDACFASLVDEVLLILCTHLKGHGYHMGSNRTKHIPMPLRMLDPLRPRSHNSIE